MYFMTASELLLEILENGDHFSAFCDNKKLLSVLPFFPARGCSPLSSVGCVLNVLTEFFQEGGKNRYLGKPTLAHLS